MCVSHFRLFETPWTVAHQASLSMGFSRQEYWSGLLFPPPGDLPDPGIEPTSPLSPGGFFTTEPPGGDFSPGQCAHTFSRSVWGTLRGVLHSPCRDLLQQFSKAPSPWRPRGRLLYSLPPCRPCSAVGSGLCLCWLVIWPSFPVQGRTG